MNKNNEQELVELLRQTGRSIEPDGDFVIKGRQDLERMIRMSVKPEDQKSPLAWLMQPLALATLVLLFMAGSGATIILADNAKPGDLLYPIDRLVESIQWRFTKGTDRQEEVARQQLEERFTEFEETMVCEDKLYSLDPNQQRAVEELRKAVESQPEPNRFLEQKQREINKVDDCAVEPEVRREMDFLWHENRQPDAGQNGQTNLPQENGSQNGQNQNNQSSPDHKPGNSR